MARSCQQRAERIEETVLRPVDRWVNPLRRGCRDQPCNWWTLCLDKLLRWVVVALVKVTLWAATVVVRWGYRTVCAVITLVVGVAALLVGRTDLLPRALDDLRTLAEDAFYSATGMVIFVALRLVDLVQTVLRLQPAKRPLTDPEREILSPIFRDSLAYDAIKVVAGPAGILTTSGRAVTMGFTIYLPSYSEQTLVHECVHTWQFQSRGFRYIGNSAFHQLDSLVFNRNYRPYDWRPPIDAGDSWFTLKSVEAQAKFIEDLYAHGIFDITDPQTADLTTPGAFFREHESGTNTFVAAKTVYTPQANAAWRILRSG